LSRSPKHRYQTTAQVLHALQALEQRAPGLSRRGKWWLSGAAACTLALGATLALQSKPHAQSSVRTRSPDAPARTVTTPSALAVPDASASPVAIALADPTPAPAPAPAPAIVKAKPRVQKPQPAAVDVDTGAWEDPFAVGSVPR
jgi:hypothetical protein